MKTLVSEKLISWKKLFKVFMFGNIYQIFCLVQLLTIRYSKVIEHCHVGCLSHLQFHSVIWKALWTFFNFSSVTVQYILESSTYRGQFLPCLSSLSMVFLAQALCWPGSPFGLSVIYRSSKPTLTQFNSEEIFPLFWRLK